MAQKKRKALGRNGGYYAFADGVNMWVYGFSAAEKRNEIRQHGPVIFYTQDGARFGEWERIHCPWHFAKQEDK